MSENLPNGASGGTPPATLLQMMTGYWVSQALSVAAELGVADLLSRTAHAQATILQRSLRRGTRRRYIGCCGPWPASASSPS